jgi:hypothetical protein
MLVALNAQGKLLPNFCLGRSAVSTREETLCFPEFMRGSFPAGPRTKYANRPSPDDFVNVAFAVWEIRKPSSSQAGLRFLSCHACGLQTVDDVCRRICRHKKVQQHTIHCCRRLARFDPFERFGGNAVVGLQTIDVRGRFSVSKISLFAPSP